MSLASLLTGENAPYIDQQYSAWREDPSSVSPEWAGFFEGWNAAAGLTNGAGPGAVIAGGAASGSDADLERRVAGVTMMVNAYRVRGHIEAEIDPLDSRDSTPHPELHPEYYKLQADLDQDVSTAPLFGAPARMKLRDLQALLRSIYCGGIGAEFMNIQIQEQKLWVQRQMETRAQRPALDATSARRYLRKVTDAERFEQSLHTRFPGTKRFSIEGGEGLVPLLDLLIEGGGEHGVDLVVLGMAHRGRLNTLVNIMDKPIRHVLDEFEDVQSESFQGSGDVKYHLGHSSTRALASGQLIDLSLAFNPSHLEAVDPVVEGRCRAHQDRRRDEKHEFVMPILIHGDAAFAGQGLVTETLNLSELSGYRTGGTIHVIVNNQIGFTATPTDSRSTPYCTDVARMLAVPIFHVNGEDALAVAEVARMAVEWRQTFHRDVIIDMYCYRRYGHNEGDEPAFTQPLLYETIRAKKPVAELTRVALKAHGFIDGATIAAVEAESDAWVKESSNDPSRAHDSYVGNTDSVMAAVWAPFKGGTLSESVDTRVPLAQLKALVTRANTMPDDFKVHRKIGRLLKQRLAMVSGDRPVDWAVGEQAAFATLLSEGYPVRLSGQDSGRGTFSHRHAVLSDPTNGAEYYPLQSVAAGDATFSALDSSLSEAAVLGFEFGYSLDRPEALVIWEAQFGDFANGAQIIIDQFIVATEQKWNRNSGVVMLLPHGYEGQGPEHSSARLERFLQLCAEDNLFVANCTTPANFYHLLRRQVHQRLRKPLVVMAPKSLLRHARATSTLEELADGRFMRVLPEADPAIGSAGVQRVVFCSGKVYYDLLEEREERDEKRVALVRLEQLHPFPADEITAELMRYAGDDGAPIEVVWCQEEPQNMGAWPMMDEWMGGVLGGRPPRYVGRRPSASPATGSPSKHRAEQAALVDEALTI